jgi:hypothetical protein
MYAVATVATGMALLAGCGGSTASPPTSPVVKTAASSAPAPSTSKSPSTSPTAEPTSTPKQKPHTKAQLRKALLALDDLPTGFQVDPPAGPDDRLAVTGKGAACERLAKELSAEKPAGSMATAQISLSGGQDGPFIDEALDAYAGAAAVEAYLKKLRADIAGCSSLTMAMDRGTAKLRVSVVSPPQLGDSSLAARFTGQGEAEGFEFTIVGIAMGDVLVGLAFAAAYAEDIDGAAEAAVDKVNEVLAPKAAA